MAFTGRQRILTLVLALVGGAAWWQQSGQGPEPPRPVQRERQPDYTVERFSALVLDPAGQPARRLSAREMRHCADDDSSELDLPELILYRPDSPPWDIRSETGWVSGDGDRVLLHGQVSADREGRGDVRPIQLRTSEMLILPRLDYAETDMPVAIDSDADWLRSTGMQVWFADKALRARFLGRARGRFDVQ
jgi:lipopolysaccharide export system protein LptC